MLRALALLPALWVVGAGASEYPFSYRRVEVAAGIHAFIEPFGHSVVSGNTLVVIGDEAVAVIDTGHHPRLARRIIAEIRALTPLPVRYVINTHWHNDHVSGNSPFVEAFAGARVIAHRFTAALLESDIRPFQQAARCTAFLTVQSRGLRDMLAANAAPDGTPLTEARRKRLEAFVADADGAIEDCADFRFRGADITFDQRITLHLGGREVQLLHPGRANTAGDIVAWVPDANVLAAGDIVVHPFPFATQSYIAEWAAALRKIEAMPFEALVPGHGAVMRDRRYVALLAELFESIAGQARAAFGEGMGIEQLRRKIDLKRFRDEIAGGDAMIGANFDYMIANLAVLRAWQELRGAMEPEGLREPG